MSSTGHPPRKRGSAADRVHLRSGWLAEREREADQRDALANEREALANERERRADRREALADDREALASERDSQAGLRGKRLDKREEGLNELQRRLAGTIEHTRALLAADRRDREPFHLVGVDLGVYPLGGRK